MSAEIFSAKFSSVFCLIPAQSFFQQVRLQKQRMEKLRLQFLKHLALNDSARDAKFRRFKREPELALLHKKEWLKLMVVRRAFDQHSVWHQTLVVQYSSVRLIIF
jgi:hypothetical protein